MWKDRSATGSRAPLYDWGCCKIAIGLATYFFLTVSWPFLRDKIFISSFIELGLAMSIQHNTEQFL
jgi:hypothetical protein